LVWVRALLEETWTECNLRCLVILYGFCMVFFRCIRLVVALVVVFVFVFGVIVVFVGVIVYMNNFLCKF